MKKIHVLLCSLLCLTAVGATSARTFELSSPDGKIKMNINADERISYNVSLDGKQVIADSYLSLATREETYGQNSKLRNSKPTSVDEEFTPVIAYKFATIENRYNQLTLNFREDFSVEFRAYDDGVAYRFVTSGKNDVEIMDEEFAVNFPAGYKAHLQLSNDFRTNQEENYSHMNLSDWKAEDKKSNLPSLFETPDGNMILICESGVLDYPQMFIKGTAGNGITSTFQKYMLEQEPQGDRSMKITKEADCIARTSGAREYPWRYFVIVENAGELLETTMTARLAPESAIEDTSWIKPGLISWEWWNGAIPYGPDVNFEAGLNTETYKYFIDFASNFGIPYIIMDEGWAARTQDPFTPNPNIDLKELIRYGEEKGVGIVLWLTWTSVENNFDRLFQELSSWGVKGLKIDFMDRNDQWITHWYEKVAAEAAKNKLLISFHGSFKPGGIEYKYPNVVTYEGVRGMEQMGGCRPENSVWMPLMRNVAGPMDYTPGAMFSMQPNAYSSQRPNSGSIGTRAYQMALFVLFETGFQMLADNPTLYYREKECTDFITSVPVTWDETRALAVEPGKYVSVAKRKGNKWFVGAMCGEDKPNWRDVDITLDFLDEGREYTMTWFEDGINAPRQAMDYRKKTAKVKKGDKVTMHIARNGGWVGVIE